MFLQVPFLVENQGQARRNLQKAQKSGRHRGTLPLLPCLERKWGGRSKGVLERPPFPVGKTLGPGLNKLLNAGHFSLNAVEQEGLL